MAALLRAITGESAIGLSATDAWAEPLPVMEKSLRQLELGSNQKAQFVG